jgi:hypothetical protein
MNADTAGAEERDQGICAKRKTRTVTGVGGVVVGYPAARRVAAADLGDAGAHLDPTKSSAAAKANTVRAELIRTLPRI